MAGSITTTSAIDELIPMIYEVARKTMLETPVMRNLVKGYDITKKPGNTITIPKWGTATAAALSQGVDMDAAQVIGTTGVTLGVSEAGAQSIVTDDDVEDATEDVIRRHGEILGDAIAEKDDTDGLALFTGLSDGLGSASTDLSVGLITAGQTRLRARKVKGQQVLVVHPYAYHAFAMSVLLNSNFGTLQPAGDEIGKRFRAKEFLGTSIYEDANIAIVDDTVDYSIGAMFTNETFGRVQKRALRIEKERDASLRAWELNATTRYQYGEVEDGFGVKMTLKTVAPTS